MYRSFYLVLVNTNVLVHCNNDFGFTILNEQSVI